MGWSGGEVVFFFFGGFTFWGLFAGAPKRLIAVENRRTAPIGQDHVIGGD